MIHGLWRWKVRLASVVGITLVAFAATLLFGTASASASCADLPSARIDWNVGASSTVVKANSSCSDLNSRYSWYADLARGQYSSGGVWYPSSVGDVYLTTGSTLRVL